MPVLDFTGPAVVRRGSIINYRTRDVLEFPLNPTSIKIAGGSNYAIDSIPGTSSPYYRWMSGKAKKFTFTLMLDGEINFRNGSSIQSAAAAGREVVKSNGYINFSVSPFMAFLDQFQYPVDPAETGGMYGGADLIVFSFGSYFPSVRCVMTDLSHEITEFDPDLSPTKCKSDVTLELYQTETMFSSSFRSSVKNGRVR